MKDYTQPISDFKFAEKQNAWLHRNNHNGDVAWRFLGFNEKGEFTPNAENEYYISVGCFSRGLTKEDYSKIENTTYDEKWNKFEQICRDKLYEGNKPRYRHSLWRFLFEFKENDILLVPGNNGDFHVFKIVSDKVIYREEIKHVSELPEDKNHDFHYFWQVEPVRVKMRRDLFADRLLSSRMKFRGTTSSLDDNLKNSIKRAIVSEKGLFPGVNALEKAKEPFMKELIDLINETQFEKLISWYFLKNGADLSKVLPKNKKGKADADVVAIFETLRIKVYVQAKDHPLKVDLDTAFSQITEYRNEHDEANRTDGYTCLYWIIYSSMEKQNEDILQKCEENDIRVISGDEFAEMLLDVGIADLDRAFFEE